MRTINFKLAAVSLVCSLAFCVVLKAQTPATPAPAATASTDETVVDPNATQFPHDAKTPPSDVTPPMTEAPTALGGYETHFAVEFGGRSLAATGNRDVYGTFVNLKPGVRLLDESLDMHSPNHDGFLFDDLSLSSFGFGGDPNEVARVRMSKHAWYKLSGSWRRDINFWDYNLLGNPLNPTTGSFVIQNNISPALLDLSRKMLDLNMTLLPDSPVQFVLGYSHYSNGGPSFNTVHESTDALLFQRWRDISDSYRFGISWHPLERTRISVDEIWTHNKSDTHDYLNSFPYSLSNGTPVNLGLISGNGNPCAAPFTGGFVTSTCSLYTGYSDNAPYYSDIPTEQIGFQTSYFTRLHVNGRASYTGAETHMPNSLEQYNGFGSNRLQSTTTGSGFAKEITTSVDGGVTYEVTERFSIDDQFRWYDYRIPSAANLVQAYLFGLNALSTPNTFSTATCPAPYTAVTCPYHTSGSSADQTASTYSMYQAQNQKRNTFELHYDLLSNLTGYVGYRFERQDIVIDGTTSSIASYFPLLPKRGSCAAGPVVNGVCQFASSSVDAGAVEINTHAGLMGFAAQPIHGLRLNADMELDYADNVFTNIMPRHMQLYRGKAIYSRKWVDLNANLRIQEMRDLAYGLGDLQHNRSFSVGAVFPISPRFGIDLNYTYDNLLTNLNICFSETPTPVYASSISPICPAGYLTTLSYYRDIDHFGTANVMFKPIRIATITAGYTITSTNGSNLLLNPLAPLGPTAINYHLPTAAIAIQLPSHVTFKAGWNLYDYLEKSPPGPVAPRNFEANVISVSLRYSM